MVIQLKAKHIQVKKFLPRQLNSVLFVTNTIILVLLPVEDHNNPTHLKAIQMFPLLVTQLQEASSSLLQLDNSIIFRPKKNLKLYPIVPFLKRVKEDYT